MNSDSIFLIQFTSMPQSKWNPEANSIYAIYIICYLWNGILSDIPPPISISIPQIQYTKSDQLYRIFRMLHVLHFEFMNK